MNGQPLTIDGKEVRNFLVAVRKKDMRGEYQHYIWQVFAFDKDHAYRRIMLAEPLALRQDIEILEELDAEADVGMTGRKLLLTPAGSVAAPGSNRIL